ncbi:MAG: hypothetical protein PHE12_00695 [Clostridia bacterium]|nr:hypothetical protein [Clostridia bacterium]
MNIKKVNLLIVFLLVSVIVSINLFSVSAFAATSTKDKYFGEEYQANKQFLELSEEEREELLANWETKNYPGQTGNGYGGIHNPSTYINNRYGVTCYLDSSKVKMLSSVNFNVISTFLNNHNNTYGTSLKNSCSIVAIAKLLKAYGTYKGFTYLNNASIDNIFHKAITEGTGNGYDPSTGATNPLYIGSIITDTIQEYGYNYCIGKRGLIYALGTIMAIVDDNKPVILNMSSGTYGSHTVLINGYKVYYSERKFLWWWVRTEYIMLAVSDGWYSDQRYIDWDAMTDPYLGDAAGFTSINFTDPTGGHSENYI